LSDNNSAMFYYISERIGDLFACKITVLKLAMFIT